MRLKVAKAFCTVWVNNLVYKLTIFLFLTYLVKTITSSSLHVRTFKSFFQSVAATPHSVPVRAAPGVFLSATRPHLPSASIFLCANDMASLPRPVSRRRSYATCRLIQQPRVPVTGLEGRHQDHKEHGGAPYDAPESPGHKRCWGTIPVGRYSSLS